MKIFLPLRIIFYLIFIAVAINIPQVASAQAVFTTHFIDRYYDADNAVGVSQILGAPLPVAQAPQGDWRISVAPAYDRVVAAPLKFSGGSLNLGYTKRGDNGWGFYGILLANDIQSSATSDAGTPNPRIMTFTYSGLDAVPSFAGKYAAGANITTFAENFGLTYSFWQNDSNHAPVTVFGGPAMTQSYASKLHTDYAFHGTYGGGANTYDLNGTADWTFTAFTYGVTLGAVTEYPLGRYFILRPHIVAVDAPLTTTHYDVTLVDTTKFNGAAGGTSTAVIHTNGRLKLTPFAIPGLDLVYRPWAISFNLVEPFGGAIAQGPGSKILHGAWPMSITISRQFGNNIK